MAKYMEIAAEANAVVQDIMEMTNGNTQVLEAVLRLYNLGIRTAPRPTQSTVRLNAVVRAAQGTPARVSMKTVEPSWEGGKPYNAIEISVPPCEEEQE